VKAPQPPPQGQENAQTPPTTNNSNSNLNNLPPPQQSKEIPKSLPPPPPPQVLNPSTAVPNAINLVSSPSSPNSNPNTDPNLNSKTTTPPAIVSPALRPNQSEPTLPVNLNPSPSQITPTNPSTLSPPIQPEIHFNSSVNQINPQQSPLTGPSPTQQANEQTGVKPTPPFNSSSLPPYVVPRYSNLVPKASTNKIAVEIGPLFIAIGAVSLIVAILILIGRKKRKLDHLVYDHGQHAKSGKLSLHHNSQSSTLYCNNDLRL
jgi:hypothetical protein